MKNFSEKLEVFPKSWAKFCSKENYINGLHSQTPWFKAEMGINLIGSIEKFNNNSWGKNLKQNLIKLLEESEVTLPKGKSLGYDVKKAVKIIEGSETPKMALERLQKELNLSPMPAQFLEVKGVDMGLSNEECLEFALMSFNMPI